MSDHPNRRKSDIEIQELKNDVSSLRDEVFELKESVQGLLTLWRDAHGAIRIIKMLAWSAATIGAIVAGMNIFNGK